MADRKGCNLAEVLRIQVRERFDRLRQAIDIREQILQRQVEALASHQICRHMMIENIDFVAEMEFDLLKKISNFGKFSIKHFLIKDDCLRVEEYIPPKDDHVEECKSIHQSPHLPPHSHHFEGPPSHHVRDKRPEVIEKSCIDLTTETGRHKIVKIREVESAHVSGKSKQNKQITIATTTQTSTQTEPPHHHHHRDSAATAQGGLRESHSSVTTKHVEPSPHCNGLPPPPPLSHPHHLAPGDKVLKNISNLTLSNANGTINLKNISNVTINSACNRLKERHCASTTTTVEEGGPGPDCGFYDRLITENKQLQYQMVKNGCGRKVTTKSITSPLSSLDHVQIETTGPDHKPVKFESNTTISNKEHPMEVQQWLKQIVYETETEPVFNSEFLEFVNIQH